MTEIIFPLISSLHSAKDERYLTRRKRTDEGGKMITVFSVTGLFIVFTTALCLYRAVAGPGVFNRVAAVNIIGTKTIALLVVMGYYFERPYFFDIALLYAMINFIGTLVFAKYLERGELWS